MERSVSWAISSIYMARILWVPYIIQTVDKETGAYVFGREYLIFADIQGFRRPIGCGASFFLGLRQENKLVTRT